MILLSLQLKHHQILQMDRRQIDEWYAEASEKGIEFYSYIDWITIKYMQIGKRMSGESVSSGSEDGLDGEFLMPYE